MILSRRTFLHVTAGVASGRPRRGRLGQAYPSRPVRTCDEEMRLLGETSQHVVRNDGVTGSNPVCGTDT